MMIPDPALTAALASLLVRALPALRTGSDEALKKLGEGVGEATLAGLKAIWAKLRGREDSRQALEKAANQPRDEAAKTSLITLLEQLLARDEQLAQLTESIADALKAVAATAGDHFAAETYASQSPIVQGAGTVNITYATAPIIGSGPAAAGAEDEELRHAYLQRLLKPHLRLPVPESMRSGTAADPLPLDLLYVALQAQAQTSSQRSAAELLCEHDRLVLIGESGAGKTTFVQFVATCLAGEALREERFNLVALLQAVTEEKSRRLATLPVSIELRRFGEHVARATGGGGVAREVLAYLQSELDAAGLAAYHQRLEKELRKSGGLLLLDGLDEVPEADDRRTKVCSSLVDFARSYPRCRLLVTSRGHAYRSLRPLLEEGFIEARLQPLAMGEIQGFVEAWLRLPSRRSAGDSTRLCHQLLDEIKRNDRLRGLAARPLFLSLLTQLHFATGGRSLMGRDRLFEAVLTLSLQAPGIEPRRVSITSGEVMREVRSALQAAAYRAHASQAAADGGAAEIPEEQLLGALIPLGRRTRVDLLEVVDYLFERAGLLVRRGDSLFSFSHRAFQEYLAGGHLLETKSSAEIVSLARADPQRWREAVILAGGRAARAADAKLWDLIDALCQREPDDDQASDRAVLMAAQIMAEFVDLTTVVDHRKPKLEQVRRWLATLLSSDRLTASERAMAGRCLASLSGPGTSFDCFLPDLPCAGFSAISAGTFRMGTDSGRDRWGGLNEPPLHAAETKRYFIARHAVTVQQFEEFLRDAGLPADSPIPDETRNQPVVQVTLVEAQNYCSWLGEKLREVAPDRITRHPPAVEKEFWQGLLDGALKIGLPSEAEWEKAARGTDGKIFPWGDDPGGDRCNDRNSGIGQRTAVGCFPAGRSAFSGCEDMSGNVWEWTRSGGGDGQIVRGGSFRSDTWQTRCASRESFPRSQSSDEVGFRVVASSDDSLIV